MNDRLEPLVCELTAGETALVSAASSLVPLLRAHAEAADTMRRLPEEDITALRDAGLFRLATPREYDGYETGACAVTAIAAELGRGCGSAAWLLAVFYAGALGVRFFTDQVQRRVWGSDPDTTVCGSAGVPVPVWAADGGYLLSGRWGWGSGAHHASWAILDIVTGADGPSPVRGIALVPMSELSVADTWHMTGMRGTGSDTICADNVFVPAEQTVFWSTAADARREGPDAGTPPLLPMLLYDGVPGALAGTVLGMGMATYDHVVEKLTDGRPLVSGAKLHTRAIDAPGVQENVADAAVLIDSAVLHSARSARAVERAARTRVRLAPLAAARSRMDAGFAVRQIRRAGDKLIDIGGAGGLAESSPVSRIWRDLGTASRHPEFVTEIVRERYARLLLGLG